MVPVVDLEWAFMVQITPWLAQNLPRGPRGMQIWLFCEPVVPRGPRGTPLYLDTPTNKAIFTNIRPLLTRFFRKTFFA